MTELPKEVSVRSILLWMIKIRGAGYSNVGGRTTRPEWRPDFRVLKGVF